LMGYFVPEVMGVGYNYVEKVLNGDLVLQVVVLLSILKIVATAVSYASGNAGGIFGPSLFIGAMMGGAVGSVAHRVLPGYTAGPGAYALVGMGTAFAGIVRTPMTSVIMIFEMTRDYTIIVPLMISNLIAFFISQRFQREPIYEALAHQDGVHLPTAESRSDQGRVRVSQVMRPAPVLLAPTISVSSAMERVTDHRADEPKKAALLDAWPVGEGRELVGMIQQSQLQQAVSHGDSNKTLAEIGDSSFDLHHADAEEFPHVHPDHTLSLALERMGTTKLHVLPVVSRANVRQLLGIVVLADVLEAYGVGGAATVKEYNE
jgi:chloride channel protein, CIC family